MLSSALTSVELYPRRLEEIDDGGIDVAAARAHHQAFQGREAHGGVDGPAVLDGRDRGAVAEVAGDDVRVLGEALEQLHGARGHVAVAGAVEAVAADLVLLVQLVGQAVQVGGRGHGLVERGVEDGHLLHVREHRLRLADADEVGRVVQGGQLHVLLDRLQHVVVDDDRGGVLLAAVHHPVPDTRDLLKAAERSLVRVRERLAHHLHGRLVVRDLHLPQDVAPWASSG